MRKLMWLKIGIIGAIICILCFSAPVSASSIGVAPSVIHLEDTFRGGEYSRTVFIMNGSATEAEYVISTEGDLASWIAIYSAGDVREPIESVIVGANNRQPVLAVFTVPGDAPSGTYDGAIIVRTTGAVPDSTGGEGTDSQGGTSITLQASVQVRISVTGTQVLSGEVTAISSERQIEVGIPFRVFTGFRNTGNVIASPLINVELASDDTVVRSLSYHEAQVSPHDLQNLMVEMDTQGLQPGDYVANVVVQLDGNHLASRELPLELLPLGTLTRDGEMVALTTEGPPTLDRVLKVLATFVNTGKIETPAQLFAEVYLNEVLVATIDSRELLALPGQEILLAAYYKVEQPGNYLISGSVNYGGRVTNDMSLAFEILAPVRSQESVTEPAAQPQPVSAEKASVPEAPSIRILPVSLPQTVALVLAIGILIATGLILWRMTRMTKNRKYNRKYTDTMDQVKG